MSLDADILEEKRQLKAVKSAIKKIADCSLIINRGDGQGGFVIDILKQKIFETNKKVISLKENKKQKIPHKLRKSVYERDGYRCVNCGSHIDLSLDHIHPESKGGLTVFENLQTMCMPCNLKKGSHCE